MYRPYNQTRRSEGNENDVESPVINRGNKFGPASGKAINSRTDAGLKLKSNNQKEFKNNKNDNSKLQKPSDKNIPQKRANEIVQQKEAKKQNTGSIEVTHRRREQEIEWAPAGLDLDFGGFSSTIEEYHSHEPVFDEEIIQESFPTIERQFNKISEPILNIEVETNIPEELLADQDTSIIEYGPPKETEIPFVPDESCIIDLSNFSEDTDFADYEICRHYHKFSTLEVPLYENEDVLQYNAIDNDSLEFEYSVDDDDDDDDDFSSSGPDFSSIPYSDHELDIEQFIKCN